MMLMNWASAQITCSCLLVLIAQRVPIASAKPVSSPSHHQTDCRSVPGDPTWPSPRSWTALNDSVDGRLILTIPLASPCHDPAYNAATCDALKASWPYAQTHVSSPSSFLAPVAQNASCDPYTPQETPCLPGNLPAYAINATTAEHIITTLRFAKDNNIRLLVKSTGHDLLGKSSGHGALSIWMHSFNNITFESVYSGPNTYGDYHGSSARIESGLVAYQIYEKAVQNGVRVLGGTCNTVSTGGGYTQSGGHSLLSTKYGLSADNVLEWDVITADGRRITATPFEHGDLYWALSGGGPGTWAVVLGVTVKTFSDGPISSAALAFTMDQAPSQDVFWQAVEEYHSFLPEYYAKGASAAYTILAGTFFVQPLTLPDRPPSEVAELVSGFTERLQDLGIQYSLNVTQHANFYEYFAAFYGPLPYGIYTHTQTQASRLIPASVVKEDASGIIEIYKTALSQPDPYFVIGNAISLPDKPSAAPSNAVHPAWRDSHLHMYIVAQWNWSQTYNENLRKQDTLLDALYPAMNDLAPSSGTYLAEGNQFQSDWQDAFYGPNYARLKAIKDQYDPDHVFYARSGVGSDDWIKSSDGRLCRK